MIVPLMLSAATFLSDKGLSQVMKDISLKTPEHLTWDKDLLHTPPLTKKMTWTHHIKIVAFKKKLKRKS